MKASLPPGHPNTRKQVTKTLALRTRVFMHCFLVFGYPGETLALVVHMTSQMSWDDDDFACVIKIFEEDH